MNSQGKLEVRIPIPWTKDQITITAVGWVAGLLLLVLAVLGSAAGLVWYFNWGS